MVGCIGQHAIYKNYGAREDGTILNLKTFRTIKPATTKDNYQRICLYLNKKQKMFRVHRFVYECFRGDIPPRLQIDHKDNDKKNNHIDNLQLLTNKENVLKDAFRRKDTRPITLFCPRTNEFHNFYSMREAARFLQVDYRKFYNATTEVDDKLYVVKKGDKPKRNFKKDGISVKSTCLDTSEERTFTSIYQASKKLKVYPIAISKIINPENYRKTAKSKVTGLWYKFEKV